MPVFSPDPDPRADLAACRATLRHGSRTFLAASLLLPSAVRDAACSLYAFCRQADDEIDLGSDPAQAHAGLTERLACLYHGRPWPSPVDRALARIVEQYGIPQPLLQALLEGFAWDASGRQYDTESDLLAYASRVAGSVGVMMALLMGQRTPHVLARAADLGIAMQLTNVARDVGEDARNGRLYLPRQWLRAAGVDPEAWLARPVFDAAIGTVVARLLQTADGLYRRADCGIAQLPVACRPGVNAARTLYWAIGGEVERRGMDSVSDRAFVPPARKLALLGTSLAKVFLPAPHVDALALAEAQHLIDSVMAEPGLRPPQPAESRIVWVIDLFDRLERRERARPVLAHRQRSASA
ncbi:phytoene/squalene synthase family protein [soil metagenome]